MPQMMPMFWLLIFIFSLFLFLVLLMMTYFFNLYNQPKIINFHNYPKFKWIWKW